MKKSFAARRAPKRIGDESESDEAAAPVKRPPLATKSSKRKSAAASSRLSFGGTSNDASAAADSGNAKLEDDDADAAAVPARRAGGLGRIALERKAAGNLPFRTGPDPERPTYDWESLKSLQNSTPSTPLDHMSSGVGDSDNEAANSAKQVMQIVKPENASVIPSEAEIREKKLRRARLAKEQEYISLDAGESDGPDQGPRQLILRETEEKENDTRLVRDDEDFAEGFDEFVEDGQVTLGRKAEREQRRKQRKEMEEMIAQAEGSGADDDDTDISEVERNAAYEAAQTRHGTYAQTQYNGEVDMRPQVPAKITPVPDLAGVLTSLNAALQSAKDLRDAAHRKVDELVAERADVAEREVWIQAQLKEMGEKYAHVNAPAAVTESEG